MEPDDLALANACYELEAELRDSGCVAVSELADMIESSPGSDLGERVLALPEPEVFDALRCVVDLGWIDDSEALRLVLGDAEPVLAHQVCASN